jgi:hypothetical protein
LGHIGPAGQHGRQRRHVVNLFVDVLDDLERLGIKPRRRRTRTRSAASGLDEFNRGIVDVWSTPGF